MTFPGAYLPGQSLFQSEANTDQQSVMTDLSFIAFNKKWSYNVCILLHLDFFLCFTPLLMLSFSLLSLTFTPHQKRGHSSLPWPILLPICQLHHLPPLLRPFFITLSCAFKHSPLAYWHCQPIILGGRSEIIWTRKSQRKIFGVSL